jgi:hypothetical protein
MMVVAASNQTLATDHISFELLDENDDDDENNKQKPENLKTGWLLVWNHLLPSLSLRHLLCRRTSMPTLFQAAAVAVLLPA